MAYYISIQQPHSYKEFVEAKLYLLLTRTDITGILSCTMLKDDIKVEKQFSRLVEAETQGFIMQYDNENKL